MTVWRVGVGDFRFKQNIRSPVTLQNVCHSFRSCDFILFCMHFQYHEIIFFSQYFLRKLLWTHVRKMDYKKKVTLF